MLLSFQFVFYFIKCYGYPRDLHSFPTRRSSDLANEFVALSSVIRSNPVKVASWSMRNVPLPTSSEEHTSELQSQSKLVRRLAHETKTVEPDEGATNVSLSVVSPTTPGEGAGAVY